MEDSDGFNPPFFGFDSQLSRVTFSFKVECKSDFDCLVQDLCVPTVPQAPAIDYLAKDYASFRQLMLDRLSQTFPQWTERSEADIGITIVELLAYAADQLSYFQDTVSNEAYLGTARQRPSLRRHARLLDYTPSEGTNARTFVHIENRRGRLLAGGGRAPFADSSATASFAEGLVLPAHTPFISMTDGLGTTNVTDADLQSALDSGSQSFETMSPLTLHAAHNRIRALYLGRRPVLSAQGSGPCDPEQRRSDAGARFRRTAGPSCPGPCWRSRRFTARTSARRPIRSTVRSSA